MRITSAKIKGLKRFMTVGEVRYLEVNPTDPLQIIIGANGHGKSSYLRALSLLPAKRSEYEEDGYIRLEVEHGGSTYEIGSNFKEKSSPHFFIKDGIHLNEGGGTSIQEDLLRIHLQYTPLLDSLISGRLDLVGMPASNRRTFFMTISPYQLEYVLDQHKRVNSALRDCKSNLTMLTKMKVALEAEMAGVGGNIDDTRTEMARLNERIVSLIGVYHQVEGLHKTAKDLLAKYPEGVASSDVLKHFGNKLNGLYGQAMSLRDVPRGKAAESHISNLLLSRAALLERKDALMGTIQEHESECTRLQESYAEIASIKSAGTIDDEIRALTEKIDSIEKEQPLVLIDPIDAGSMGAIREAIPAIQDLTAQLVDVRYPLIPYAELQREKENLHAAGMAEWQCLKAIEQLEETRATLKRAMSIRREDIPDQPCAKRSCPLYVEFMTTHDRNVERLMKISDDLLVQQEKLAGARLYIEKNQDRVSLLDRCTPILKDLFQYINGIKSIKHMLADMDILRQLSESPVVVLDTIRNKYQRSYVYHEVYLTAKAELTERLKEKAAASAVGEKELSMMLRFLEERRRDLYRAQRELDQVRSKIQDKDRDIKLAQNYIALVGDVDDLDATIRQRAELEILQFEVRHLEILLGALQDEKNDCVASLGRLQSLISKQTALGARYNDEVLVQLREVEVARDELVEIEKSLSPNTGIPHIYSVTFINEVIDVVNEYLQDFWGYPFGLVPLDHTEPLDFGAFKVYAPAGTVPDMSECSDSQKEVLKYVLIFAIRKVLGLADYPLQLDEIGRAFDPYHKQKLPDFLRRLVDEGECTQLFLVNHHATVHEGFDQAEVMVLGEHNVLKPPIYNQHVIIQT